MRALLGTIGGAFFGGTVGAGVIGMLLAIPLVTGNVHPMDHEYHLWLLGFLCAFSGVCGLILGALAGFASRFPKSGVPFFWCCVLIAVPVAVVRCLTAPLVRPVQAVEFYFSYFYCFATAVLAAAILVWWGLKRERTSASK